MEVSSSDEVTSAIPMVMPKLVSQRDESLAIRCIT